MCRLHCGMSLRSFAHAILTQTISKMALEKLSAIHQAAKAVATEKIANEHREQANK